MSLGYTDTLSQYLPPATRNSLSRLKQRWRLDCCLISEGRLSSNLSQIKGCSEDVRGFILSLQESTEIVPSNTPRDLTFPNITHNSWTVPQFIGHYITTTAVTTLLNASTSIYYLHKGQVPWFFFRLCPYRNIHAVTVFPHYIPVTQREQEPMMPREPCSCTNVAGGKSYRQWCYMYFEPILKCVFDN